MTTDEKLNAILKAIYWDSFTKKQRKDIAEVLEDDEIPERETLICDYLNIERRGNRSEIRKIINQQP